MQPPAFVIYRSGSLDDDTLSLEVEHRTMRYLTIPGIPVPVSRIALGTVAF